MKVLVIQTNEAGNIASVMDPRGAQLLYAGRIEDVIQFVKESLIPIQSET